MEKDEELEKVRQCLLETLHYLATVVNGDEEDYPNFWEKAKDQVLEGRKVLANWKKGKS